jgi:N-sulfoglucosamine sulfohydrolase
MQQDSNTQKPNVVLIVTDDHGLDAAGCFGNRIIKTPNLDGLAADGVIFTSAFCTSSSCSPSRAVILTGKYSHATGMYGLEHDIHHFACFDNVESLPVFLSRAGYRTARVGKYHVAPESVFKFQKVIKANGRNAVEMAERCESVITDKTKPFFLYFCTLDPHRSEPARCESLPYGPNLFGNRPEGYPGVKRTEYDPKDVIVPSFMSDSNESRAELAQYYQSVSRIDQGLGRLFELLKNNGQYDNTLIIYISDNGVAFPGAKTTLYLPGMRLPCIVKPPGWKRPSGTCEALVNWADLAPTILDYAEAMPEKPDFHGRSFRTALQEENIQGWDVTYASHSYHEVTMYYTHLEHCISAGISVCFGLMGLGDLAGSFESSRKDLRQTQHRGLPAPRQI